MVFNAFSTVFQLYRGGQCTYPCIPRVLLASTTHNILFFPSHWLLSDITIIETTDSSEREMNPVAMTIINPRKDYWPSRLSHQRPVLKSATLPTEVCDSAATFSTFEERRSRPEGAEFHNHSQEHFLSLSASFVNFEVTQLLIG